MTTRALLSMALLSTGCTYSATFRSDPSGARVLVDGQLVGVTPLTRDMPEDVASYALRFELDGYAPATRVVSPEPTGTFVSTTVNQAPAVRVFDADSPTLARDLFFHEIERQRSFTSATTSREVRAWPAQIFVRLEPSPGRVWTPSPALPPPAPRRPSPPPPPPPRQAPPPPPPAPAPRAAFCGACGSRVAGGRFCGDCGARVEARQ